jgi:hypothetical protein
VGTAIAALLGGAAPLAAQSVQSAALLERWVTAATTHVAGTVDAAVGSAASLSYHDRLELNPAMRMFLAHMRGEKFATKDEGGKRIVAAARQVEETPGVTAFLKRAVVLHTDAAIFANRFPAPPDDAPRSVPSSAGRRLDPPVPLLWNEPVVLTRDGQLVGEAVVTWHLVFARSLVDPRPFGPMAPGDDFVGEWYHAIAAYLFANGMNGDAAGHLNRAAQVCPNDARLVFDRATYAETLGLPIYQVVHDDPRTWRPGFAAQIPTEERTNAEAERLYRRALEIDPSYVEASVRLARLLDHRGQHDEAAAEISKVLDANVAGVVGFYARLVAGRIASSRGRYDEALQRYRDALKLFGTAQSAIIGSSHAALMGADVADALAPLGHLRAIDATFNSDPWWDYPLGAGRDVNALMAHLWSRVVAK